MKQQMIITTLILAAIVIIGNAVINRWSVSVDLTEDKRFSLSQSTEDVLESIDVPIFIRVLLSGDFPAEYERLEEATVNLLRRYRSINPNIHYVFENPSEGSPEEVNQRYEVLAKQGLVPSSSISREVGELNQQLIFPYAIVNAGERNSAINLLKANERGESDDVNINSSIALLEYKLADKLYKMTRKDKPNVVILDGRGGLLPAQTASFESMLKLDYDFGRLNIDSIIQIPEEIDLVIVPRPTIEFSDRDQLVLDQYIMYGGKVLWMVEKFEANVFAIDSFANYVPKTYEHGLDDLFFDYGVRYKANLLLDLQCSGVPQVVASQGGKPQTEMFPWYYHPIIQGSDNSPITKNVSNINMTFPSEIEILERDNVELVPLLQTSKNTRFQVYPMELDFNVVQLGEDPSKFDKGAKSVAVMGQGSFKSHFKNRLSKSQLATLESMGRPFKGESEETTQIWFSDAYLISNLYNPATQRISPLGFNQWEQRIFSGNQEIMLNLVDYLVDDVNVMEARNKDVKLRLLNRAKVLEERTFWQVFNLVLPILLLVIFGFVFSFLRKRRYA